MNPEPSVPPSERLLPPRRRALALAGAVMLVLAALALLVWCQDADRRTIARLPPGERAALFERTRANVEALCPPEGGGGRRCREQAEFLLAFSECDDSCRQRAYSVLHPASR